VTTKTLKADSKSRAEAMLVRFDMALREAGRVDLANRLSVGTDDSFTAIDKGPYVVRIQGRVNEADQPLLERAAAIAAGEGRVCWECFIVGGGWRQSAHCSRAYLCAVDPKA
jgi:hypothetical protein